MARRCTYFSVRRKLLSERLPIACTPSHRICTWTSHAEQQHISDKLHFFSRRPLQKDRRSIACVFIFYFPIRIGYRKNAAANAILFDIHFYILRETLLAACQNDGNLWMFIFADASMQLLYYSEFKIARTHSRWIHIPLATGTAFENLNLNRRKTNNIQINNNKMQTRANSVNSTIDAHSQFCGRSPCNQRFLCTRAASRFYLLEWFAMLAVSYQSVRQRASEWVSERCSLLEDS